MRKYRKFPRIYHLPWSEDIKVNDRVYGHTDMFKGKEVIVSFKMDGENTSIYDDGFCHARSIDSKNHWSRHWVKRFASEIGFKIPCGWRICGENMYAVHSIYYDQLESYLYGFCIWSAVNYYLSYDTTIMWFDRLGVIHVPVIYRGIYDETKIRALDLGNNEGYVIRVADEFHYDDFKYNIAKFVRSKHVKTDKHWMYKNKKRNKLK